jgi:DNA-binding NarL/FixJ family response regulator
MSHTLNPFSDVSVLVQTQNTNLLNVVKVVCAAFGLRRVHECFAHEALADTFELVDPDLVICGLSQHPEAQLQALSALRRWKGCSNAYFPAIVISPYTEKRWVMASINAGAHEFVALPVSPKRLWLAINHAVFIGRPFVETSTYFGPCRRRRHDPEWSGPERRADGKLSDGGARQVQEARMGQIMDNWRKS